MGLDLLKKSAKIIITLVVILSLSLGLINTDIFADFDKFKIKDVNVETTTDSISVTWADLSDSYLISLDGNSYTKTTKNSITIDKLNSDHPYEVNVKAESKNKENIIHQFTVQTLTKREKTDDKDGNLELEDGQTTAIFTDSEAKVIFENVPDDDLEYTVERNNKKFGKLKGKKNFIIDSDLDSDTSYRYALIGKAKLSKKEKDNAINTIKKQNLNPKDFNIEEMEIEYELARSLKTLKGDQQNSAYAYGSWEDHSPGVEFFYTTFIPMGLFTFEPPLLAKGIDYATGLGDDRGFDPYVLSPHYRTRTWVRVSFPAYRGSEIRFYRIAQPSVGKNKKTGRWEVSGPVDISKIYLGHKNEGDTKATFTLNHEAGSPFAALNVGGGSKISGPAINYHYTAEVYRNGYFKIVGAHDKAPNHEMSYTPIPGETHWEGGHFYTSMRSLFQFSMGKKPEGLKNLAGPPLFPQRAFNEQGYWK